MAVLQNLSNWWNLATQNPSAARQALGQTAANVSSRLTGSTSGPVTGLSNWIAGTGVTGAFDVPKVYAAEPKPLPSLNQQQMYPSQSFGQISAYKPPVVQKVNNTPTTQNTDTGFQFPQLNITAPNESMGGGPSEMDVINNEFNAFNQYLDQQEGQAQSNFTETQGLYDVQKANAEKQYGQEKTT